MNNDVAVEAFRTLAVFRYGGFENEAIASKWLHGTETEEEDCKNQRKQAPTRHQPYIRHPSVFYPEQL